MRVCTYTAALLHLTHFSPLLSFLHLPLSQIWNFMAIHHVLRLFPQMNDLPNYEALRSATAPAAEKETDK